MQNPSISAKRHRYPVSIISQTIWLYHRYNLSYRDISELLKQRGIEVSHESIRHWCNKFSRHFADVIRKRNNTKADKWHLDEMNIRIKGEKYVLWRAVDGEGNELDVYLQKRRNKKSAIRFLTRLLKNYDAPRVIITDKLRSYTKPIKKMLKQSQHRRHKRLNNRIENAHQPTRRKEKCLIKFKSPHGVQRVVSLMGQVRNIFSNKVGRYKNSSAVQKERFNQAQSIWDEASDMLHAA